MHAGNVHTPSVTRDSLRAEAHEAFRPRSVSVQLSATWVPRVGALGIGAVNRIHVRGMPGGTGVDPLRRPLVVSLVLLHLVKLLATTSIFTAFLDIAFCLLCSGRGAQYTRLSIQTAYNTMYEHQVHLQVLFESDTRYITCDDSNNMRARCDIVICADPNDIGQRYSKSGDRDTTTPTTRTRCKRSATKKARRQGCTRTHCTWQRGSLYH